MAKVISIINDKGGVAKTTTTINLGTALWLLGKRVLLVDTDKQCNMTITIDRIMMTMASTIPASATTMLGDALRCVLSPNLSRRAMRNSVFIIGTKLAKNGLGFR